METLPNNRDLHRDSVDTDSSFEDRETTSGENLLSAFERFEDQYGRESVLELISLLHDRADGQPVDLKEVFEGKTERAVFQEHMLASMEHLGLVERDEEGVVVVDDKQLLEVDTRVWAQANRKQKDGVHVVPGWDQFGGKRVNILANTFNGLDVRLKSQGDEGEVKSLFYQPKSREEALDIEAIRQADFHFGLWEVKAAFREEGKELLQPGAVDDVSMLEASIAAAVYHPKYGGAERKKKRSAHC